MRTYQRFGLSILSPVLAVSVALSGLACASDAQLLPVNTPTVQPTTRPNPIPLPGRVRLRVLRQASQDLGQPMPRLQMGAYSQQTWSDSCLGLGGPAESCAAVLVEGWQVAVSAGDRTQVYRTDRTGQTIRAELNTPDPSEQSLPEAVRDRVLAQAALDLGQPISQLAIGQYQRAMWPDGCLGVPSPVELCLAALTPGWSIDVNGNGTAYTYRTDLTADQIRRAPQLDGLNGLSAATRDRLIAYAATLLERDAASLQVTQADIQGWDGCLGIYPEPLTPCTQIYLPGWRAVVTDGSQNWVFHLDNLGDRIALNSWAGPTTAAVRLLPRGNAMPLGDETLLQVEMSGGIAGEMRQYLVEGDGRVILLRSSPQARYAPQVIQQLSAAELETFIAELNQAGLANLNGVAYEPPAGGADYIWMTLRTPFTYTQYVDSIASELPPSLSRFVTAWQAIATE